VGVNGQYRLAALGQGALRQHADYTANVVAFELPTILWKGAHPASREAGRFLDQSAGSPNLGEIRSLAILFCPY
jgi:hypothetical protein